MVDERITPWLRHLPLAKQLLVLEEEGYLFFLNSKCASSSVRRMALNTLGYKKSACRADLPYVRKLDRLQCFEHLTWLMITRDPFDRIASLWADKVYRKRGRRIFSGFRELGLERKDSFLKFLQAVCGIRTWQTVDSHLWPQTILFSSFKEQVRLIPLETLGGWPDDLPELAVENQGDSGVDYKVLYEEPECRWAVLRLYSNDFTELGYATGC